MSQLSFCGSYLVGSNYSAVGVDLCNSFAADAKVERWFGGALRS
jgi:hypothetical protein